MVTLRKSKPSSIWTTRVFSSASRSPSGARTAATSSRSASACWRWPFTMTTRRVAEGLVTALGPVPGADLRSHGLHRLRADRGQERHEMLAVLALGQPRPELIPQERERRDLMIVTPVGVLAVDNPGLARMQFQAHF